MQDVTIQLTANLSALRTHWSSFSDIELSHRPGPGRWSKKEILGHLIDSAANNHPRFILAQSGPEPYLMIPYDHERWVGCSSYSTMPADGLLALWLAYNEHLGRLIQRIPAAALGRACRTPSGNDVTLDWVVRDYVLHLEHHVHQIIYE